MPRITLKNGLKFELHNREYELIECVAPGEWKVLDIVTKKTSNLSEDVMMNFLFNRSQSFTFLCFRQRI